MDGHMMQPWKLRDGDANLLASANLLIIIVQLVN